MSTFTVKVDREKFQADVKALLSGTEVWKEFQDVKKLSWPEAVVPPQVFGTVKEVADLIGAITAAVEIVKQNAIKLEDPDGTKGAKFDKQLALETAVKLFDDAVVFEGFVGTIVDKLDAPILNLLISVYIASKPANWIDIAKTLLKL